METETMTITEAQKKIDEWMVLGLILEEEASHLGLMIRRTKGYGCDWSRKLQSKMRANLFN